MTAVRAARWAFTAAGIYGLAATLQLYFRDPPAGAALWYWGFAGAAAATQLLYLLIGCDPLRYAQAIPVGIASKLSFFLPATALYAMGRIGFGLFVAALIDLALLVMFGLFYVRLGSAKG